MVWPVIEVKHISKSFGKEQVLHDISFSLMPQQTLSVLGRSGCGKTTLLKIMAGILPAESGSFRIGETEILQLQAQARGVVYLSQEPLLFPHLNVLENIAFGLRIRKIDKTLIQKRVVEMLDALGLGGMSQKMPTELSGGQKQRVAFGRAIIIEPKVLLLDEPFGSLDVETRGDMQALFKELSHNFGITSLFVTHDLKEALVMGDAIGRMVNGRLQVYPDRQAFINDPASGVQEERDFWTQISNENESI